MATLTQLNQKRISISFFVILLLLVCWIQESTGQIEIKGIYGHPKPIWEKGFSLPELGINAIFVHSGAIDSTLVERAKNEGLKIYAEFATLNGKNYVQKHPEAWAINEKGKRVEAASWFMGVCPTEPGFRNFRFRQLHILLNDYEIDGIWMDYVHWHAQFEEPEPILPETCFCDNCLSSFSEEMNVDIPEGSIADKAQWILQNKETTWRDWRCKVIYDWSVQIRNIIKLKNPELLLGIYHCPWDDDEFKGARRIILGLDYDLLRDVFDVFSPMVYHARMGREPDWVEENIKWFCKRININQGTFPKIWPIVQAYNNPYNISASEFETVLKGGMVEKSSGIMMFTTRAVAEDAEKIAVVKKIYQSATQ